MDGFQMDQTVITQLGLLPIGILKGVNGGAVVRLFLEL